jgi:hypothetical protein
MSVDFIRNRESHITLTQKMVYSECYKLVSEENLSLGDRVVLHLTDGSWYIAVVTSIDPLEMCPYTPRKYIKESEIYSGSYNPEEDTSGLD